MRAKPHWNPSTFRYSNCCDQLCTSAAILPRPFWVRVLPQETFLVALMSCTHPQVPHHPPKHPAPHHFTLSNTLISLITVKCKNILKKGLPLGLPISVNNLHVKYRVDWSHDWGDILMSTFFITDTYFMMLCSFLNMFLCDLLKKADVCVKTCQIIKT